MCKKFALFPSVNILGGKLRPCSNDPITGFFRDGFCNTCKEDSASHTVCAEISYDFLAYSKGVGNDLKWFCKTMLGICAKLTCQFQTAKSPIKRSV